MTQKHGSEAVIAAVARAEARAAGGDPQEVQIDLLPPTRFHPVDQPGNHAKMAEGVARHRRGRPPGAQNKTTREMLDFVRQTIGDPMLESARWLGHTPETLAAELGCDKLEAFDRLEKIRADLRPYFYAKQAPVDHDGKPVPGLTLELHGHGGRSIGQDGQEIPPWLQPQNYPAPDAQPQQNQQLIDVTPQRSHGEGSHEPE